MDTLMTSFLCEHWSFKLRTSCLCGEQLPSSSRCAYLCRTILNSCKNLADDLFYHPVYSCVFIWCACSCMSQYTYRGQRTTCKGWISPSTMWDLQFKLRFRGKYL